MQCRRGRIFYAIYCLEQVYVYSNEVIHNDINNIIFKTAKLSKEPFQVFNIKNFIKIYKGLLIYL